MDAFTSAPYAPDSSMPHQRQPYHRASKPVVQSQGDSSQLEQRRTSYNDRKPGEKLSDFKELVDRSVPMRSAEGSAEEAHELGQGTFGLDCCSGDIGRDDSETSLQSTAFEHGDESLSEKEIEAEVVVLDKIEPQVLEYAFNDRAMHTGAVQLQQPSTFVGEVLYQSTNPWNVSQGGGLALSQRFLQQGTQEVGDTTVMSKSDSDAEVGITSAVIYSTKVSGVNELYRQTVHMDVAGVGLKKLEGTASPLEPEQIDAKPEFMAFKPSSSVARIMPAAVYGLGSQAEVARQISEQLTAAVRQTEQGRTEITLSPEGLGRIRLTVTHAEGGAVVSLLVEKDDTEALLKRHMDELAQEFSREGFEGSHFLFEQADSGFSASEDDEVDSITDDYVTLEAARSRASQHEAGNGLDIKI